MFGAGTEVAVAVVGVAGGMVLEWLRARSARTLATLQVADSRERRLQDAADALIDDYRQRLGVAHAELEREARIRHAMLRQLRRLEAERRHYHPRPRAPG